MRLIVGLGNPGARYERTRHNVGFVTADAIHRRHAFGPWRAKFQGLLAEGALGGKRLYLLKPQTFMNASGESVAEAARFYKIPVGELAVIHDEIDLEPGKLRVKQGGGAAGHNGLRSIDAQLGDDYWRIRIGIGHPGVKELVEPYVLQNFSAEDQAWLPPLIGAIADAFPVLIADGAGTFTTRVALILKPNRKEPSAGK
ncbi:MAG TPA: aminoacyl-tRNA hydrolase [Stellaceae bacterium]|nr:aminoacyl-tRNA hydrolase [Stellaceae bacterium]